MNSSYPAFVIELPRLIIALASSEGNLAGSEYDFSESKGTVKKVNVYQLHRLENQLLVLKAMIFSSRSVIALGTYPTQNCTHIGAESLAQR